LWQLGLFHLLHMIFIANFIGANSCIQNLISFEKWYLPKPYTILAQNHVNNGDYTNSWKILNLLNFNLSETKAMMVVITVLASLAGKHFLKILRSSFIMSQQFLKKAVVNLSMLGDLYWYIFRSSFCSP